MLKPAWYLTDGDYFGELPKVAQMNTVKSAIGVIAQSFGDEGGFSPEQTAAATYLALLAAEHLNDEITYNARDTARSSWPGRSTGCTSCSPT